MRELATVETFPVKGGTAHIVQGPVTVGEVVMLDGLQVTVVGVEMYQTNPPRPASSPTGLQAITVKP
jgi:hypothetical protein